MECVREMKSPGVLHALVGVAINYSLENTSECRQLVGQLFHKLLEDGTLAVDKMVAGYVCVCVCVCVCDVCGVMCVVSVWCVYVCVCGVCGVCVYLLNTHFHYTVPANLPQTW